MDEREEELFRQQDEENAKIYPALYGAYVEKDEEDDECSNTSCSAS